jgi:hypothetical protein
MIEIPKNPQKKVIVLTGIVVSVMILVAIIFLVVLPQSGSIFFQGIIPGGEQGPREHQTDLIMPLFRITENPNDTVSYENWSATMQFADAPSPDECPSAAARVLESYGGIPRDAQLESIKETSNGCEVSDSGKKCYVTSRKMVYREKPYNVALHGKRGGMVVELGAGGLPGIITKQWVTLEEVGTEHIIPASDAITRLRLGEGKNIPPDPLDLTVLSVEPGYYVPENITNVSYLEPVWAVSARDEIQKKTLTVYVPAGKTPAQREISPMFGTENFKNFTEAGGTIPGPDVSSASHVFVGTSGPVGKDAARESIRKFTANPGIALDYHGESSDRHEGCGGQNYNWVFYDFTSGSCKFYVDTYTGSVIYATTDPGCTNTGIPDLPSLAVKSEEEAKRQVSEYLRQKYPQYDRRHIVFQFRYLPDSYHKDIEYFFTGDNTNIVLSFDPADGHLKDYAAYNSNRVGMCASTPGIVIIAVLAMVFLYRRKR